MPKLSTKPYKGTRDFYPEDQFIQNYITAIMSLTAEQFGFVQYNASIIEHSEIYKAKSGDEIVNEQTYTFTDRGGRDITIRPEMTPTIARMIAEKRRQLAFPVRWYSIPNLMRYERPQRGRLREHWQLNADIIGIDNIQGDAEVILLAHQIMVNFGANSEYFAIKLNDRNLINSLINDYFKLNKNQSHATCKLIDRRAKMKKSVFEKELKEVMPNKAADFLNLLNDVEKNGFEALPEKLKNTKGVKNLQELFTILQNYGITNFQFDMTLMRGFDYYTGIIFEVFDTNPINKRALFGGGRYDGLVGIFDVEPISAVGFGMGDVTIRDYLDTYDLLPQYTSSTDLYICTYDKSFFILAQQIAQEFRQNDINVAVDLTGRKIPSQIKTADKQSIPYIICIGEEETKTKKFKLKNLATHKEETLTLDAIIKKFAE